ncbi:hypothetical protein ACFY8P_04500 [Streptomyces sp. NPDC012693]|uniref:hypothetical protein n=1 Tax=Streptomyces sp. NPDC012693 TaxID=3364844 RepID=UPI0036D05CBB
MTETPQPARDQLYALNALMRDLEDPLKTYNQCLRKAWRTLTDSPENDAAQAKGNATLLEIEQVIRQWVAKHPEPDTTETCGLSKGLDGTDYRACARERNHWQAYCRSADGQHLFLAHSRLPAA